MNMSDFSLLCFDVAQIGKFTIVRVEHFATNHHHDTGINRVSVE